MKSPEKERTERGASPWGLEILWVLYRLLGLRALHVGARAVGLCVWLFSPTVRRRAPRPAKVLHFTCSLADKLVVMAEGAHLPRVSLRPSPDADRFVADVAAKTGVFVLSSHVGTIEVLAALPGNETIFHAWMEFTRTSVFNAFYLRHAKRPRVRIHPISAFGPETVFFAGDALDRGECLVMAGDRGFGRKVRVPFGPGSTELPAGAFRFAHVLEHPVYFVACVATGDGAYEAVVRRLAADTPAGLAAQYAAALWEVSRQYPDQVFQWN